jgi:hypothetical protein
MIHCPEPIQILFACPNSDEPQLDVSRFPKELGESAHSASGVASPGKMPKSLAAACVETAFARGLHKAIDGLFVSGSEIERFVEFTGARQLGAAWTQAGIVGNLAKAHVMESGYPDRAILRDFIERLADFCVRAALRDAEIARRAHGTRNPQTEVAIRKEDSPAIFSHEGVVVPELAAQGLDFLPGPRGEQDESNFSPFQFCQSLFRACKRIRVRIDQGAFEGRKDQMMGGKQDTKQCSVRGPGLEAGCLDSRGKLWWVLVRENIRLGGNPSQFMNIPQNDNGGQGTPAPGPPKRKSER